MSGPDRDGGPDVVGLRLQPRFRQELRWQPRRTHLRWRRTFRFRRSRFHARRGLRTGHLVGNIRPLPSHVRGHHASPHHRRRRRAHEVLRSHALLLPLDDSRLLPRRPRRLGRHWTLLGHRQRRRRLQGRGLRRRHRGPHDFGLVRPAPLHPRGTARGFRQAPDAPAQHGALRYRHGPTLGRLVWL